MLTRNAMAAAASAFSLYHAILNLHPGFQIRANEPVIVYPAGVKTARFSSQYHVSKQSEHLNPTGSCPVSVPESFPPHSVDIKPQQEQNNRCEQSCHPVLIEKCILKDCKDWMSQNEFSCEKKVERSSTKDNEELPDTSYETLQYYFFNFLELLSIIQLAMWVIPKVLCYYGYRQPYTGACTQCAAYERDIWLHNDSSETANHQWQADIKTQIEADITSELQTQYIYRLDQRTQAIKRECDRMVQEAKRQAASGEWSDADYSKLDGDFREHKRLAELTQADNKRRLARFKKECKELADKLQQEKQHASWQEVEKKDLEDEAETLKADLAKKDAEAKILQSSINGLEQKCTEAQGTSNSLREGKEELLRTLETFLKGCDVELPKDHEGLKTSLRELHAFVVKSKAVLNDLKISNDPLLSPRSQENSNGFRLGELQKKYDQLAKVHSKCPKEGSPRSKYDDLLRDGGSAGGSGSPQDGQTPPSNPPPSNINGGSSQSNGQSTAPSAPAPTNAKGASGSTTSPSRPPAAVSPATIGASSVPASQATAPSLPNQGQSLLQPVTSPVKSGAEAIGQLPTSASAPSTDGASQPEPSSVPPAAGQKATRAVPPQHKPLAAPSTSASGVPRNSGTPIVSHLGSNTPKHSSPLAVASLPNPATLYAPPNSSPLASGAKSPSQGPVPAPSNSASGVSRNMGTPLSGALNPFAPRASSPLAGRASGSSIAATPNTASPLATSTIPASRGPLPAPSGSNYGVPRNSGSLLINPRSTFAPKTPGMLGAAPSSQRSPPASSSSTSGGSHERVPSVLNILTQPNPNVSRGRGGEAGGNMDIAMGERDTMGTIANDNPHNIPGLFDSVSVAGSSSGSGGNGVAVANDGGVVAEGTSPSSGSGNGQAGAFDADPDEMCE